MHSVNVTLLSADTIIGRSPYLGIACEASSTVSNFLLIIILVCKLYICSRYDVDFRGVTF